MTRGYGRRRPGSGGSGHAKAACGLGTASNWCHTVSMLRGPLILAIVLLLITVGSSPSTAAFPGRNGRIAFEVLGASARYQIIAMTARRTKRRTKRRILTHSRQANSTSPAYSPRGRRIVFERTL